MKKKFKKRVEIESNTAILELNIHKLEDEWVNQPKLCSQTADKLADAKRELAQAEARLEEVKADIARNVRMNPSNYDVEKVTENTVKELIPLQSAYQEAQQECIQAKYAVDRLVGDSKTVDHRKYALQNLVELFLADYFSEPRAKRPGTNKAMEQAKKNIAFSRMQQRKEEDDE